MKADSLIHLRMQGFNVPDGFVVTTDEIHSFTRAELGALVDDDVAYAVRSSGTIEDMEDLSFAGQYDTYLDVQGLTAIQTAIEKCAASIDNASASAYAHHHGIDLKDCKMAVIVQRMVPSEKAGVAFSIDAVNGLDREIIIEAVSGLGDQLVSGQVTPDYYAYNWYNEEFTSCEGGVLSQDEVRRIASEVLSMQICYGFPVDVEWAIADGEIYILQSRPVTTINFKAISREWTTADFRDGGVSAQACKALMGSLYGLVFSHSFLDSLKRIRLLSRTCHDSIYETFFARPYWCLSVEKECFAKLPGFIEKELDEDMGIIPSYEGNGVETRLGLKSIWSSLLVLSAVSRYIREMESKTEERKADILRRFEKVEQLELSGRTAEELHELWVDFINVDYYYSEYTYFSYIFCNMILSTLFKDKVKKYLPANEIMNLMMGLLDLSHMRPIYEMWEMSQRPYQDAEFEALIKKYSYHSQHELDISYPNWDEEPRVVQGIIHSFTLLETNSDPRKLGELQRQKYLSTRAKLPKGLHKDVEQLRNFLWWREEFRDISTRSYYLIRRLTLALGRSWADAGLLEEADDIFFLTVNEIEEKLDLREKAKRNKQYFSSFCDFKNPNEIGSRYKVQRADVRGVQVLKGVPCSGETLTATARVVTDIHDADRLQQGDILVTRCTDPAWTAVFSRIGGVITETGGMLSHAAVVSREYGIACILVVKNATDVIKDGDVITMDCDTGEIYQNL